MTIHRRLEERLAEFKRRESALLFGSGFLANAGVIAALARPGDVVFSDELNHASIIDGCRLSRAEVFVYDHCDVEHLSWGISQAEGRGALIVTDSVFSMDGDVAPLAEIVELARRHRVRVLVDEAHGTGALGPGGRGALAEAGLEDEVDVIVGTLGKSLGSYGAFAACDREMADYLLNTARTFIFSTALPPPAAAGALAALDAARVEGPSGSRSSQRTRPRCAARSPTRASTSRGSRTQIMPLVLGDAEHDGPRLRAALERGVFAQAIRPPTVPPMTSRLRLAVMASHRAGRAARRRPGRSQAPRGRRASSRASEAVAELSATASGVFDVERATGSPRSRCAEARAPERSARACS